MRSTSGTVGVREEERIQGTGGHQGVLIDVRGMTRVTHDLCLQRMHVAATCGSGQATVRKTSSQPREADAGALGGAGSGIGADATTATIKPVYADYRDRDGESGVRILLLLAERRRRHFNGPGGIQAGYCTASSRASFPQREGETGRTPGMAYSRGELSVGGENSYANCWDPCGSTWACDYCRMNATVP